MERGCLGFRGEVSYLFIMLGHFGMICIMGRVTC